jgi:anti-sigma B factor antagonist
MEILSSSKGDIKILGLSGRFDTQTAPEVNKWMQDATSSSPAQVVVDLSDVSFLDSTALSTLVQGLKRSRELKGEVRLCGLHQPVRMIFELTRLDKAFEIFNNQEDAIAAFNAT